MPGGPVPADQQFLSQMATERGVSVKTRGQPCFQRLPRTSLGSPGPPRTSQMLPRTFLAHFGLRKASLGSFGFPGCPRGFPGPPWNVLTSQELPGVSLGSPGLPRTSQGLLPASPGRPDVPGASPGLPGTSGCARGFPGPPWSLVRLPRCPPSHSDLSPHHEANWT